MARIFYCIVLAALALSAAPLAVVAGDPDILTDFIPPTFFGFPLNVSSDYFTYSGFRAKPIMPPPPTVPLGFSAMKASMAEFPALNGQSVSMAKLVFPVGTVNPTHTHPRAAELLLVVEGALCVGFVDTTNKLYTKVLLAGDMFVFPKGMVHYQINPWNTTAVAISAFGSANAGTVSLPATLFGADDIDSAVLAKSFKTDEATIQKLKGGLTPPKMA